VARPTPPALAARLPAGRSAWVHPSDTVHHGRQPRAHHPAHRRLDLAAHRRHRLRTPRTPRLAPSMKLQPVRAKLGRAWGHSSAGRAPALQAGGQGFDPPWLHRTEPLLTRGFRRFGLTVPPAKKCHLETIWKREPSDFGFPAARRCLLAQRERYRQTTAETPANAPTNPSTMPPATGTRPTKPPAHAPSAAKAAVMTITIIPAPDASTTPRRGVWPRRGGRGAATGIRSSSGGRRPGTSS
jgi:hypothetical protein